MEPEIAVGLVATGVALASFLNQAVSQRRSTRLALFEHRVELFANVSELLSVAEVFARHPDMFYDFGGTRLAKLDRHRGWKEGVGKRWDRRLRRCLSTVEADRNKTRFLFGDDVVEFADEVLSASRSIRIAIIQIGIDAGRVESGEDPEMLNGSAKLDHARRRVWKAERLINRVYAPYLENDRLLGVPFWHKAELSNQRAVRRRDPAMRPQPPYLPGSSE